MNLKIKKISFMDLIILQVIIVMLAFRDYSNLSIISQVVAFIFVFFNEVRIHGYKINMFGTRYLFLKVLFIVWCFVSAVWAINSYHVLSICITLVLRMLTGFSIILYAKNEQKIKKVIVMMIIASFILCLRLFFVVPTNAWGNIRIGNLLAHDKNNSYGNTGITYVLGLVAIYLMVSNKFVKNNKLRIVLIILFTTVSLLSGSKKQLFLLIITILILAFYKSKNILSLVKNCILSFACIVISIVIIFNNQYLYNVIGNRLEAFSVIFFSETNNTTDASTESRTLFLKDAFKVFNENPITGVGIDCYRYVNPYREVWAENNFLELLADVGILGFIFYYILSLQILYETIKRIKYKNEYDILLIILFACFLLIDFTMVSYANNTLQLNFALMYAINSFRNKEEKGLIK